MAIEITTKTIKIIAKNLLYKAINGCILLNVWKSFETEGCKPVLI